LLKCQSKDLSSASTLIADRLYVPVEPTLRSFDTVITRIEPRKFAGSKATNAKKKGANSKVPEKAGVEWEIECEDTSMLTNLY
jgi:hypothetical protein